MAYKDEYEVARLYSDGTFARQLADRFGTETRLRFHMAPPLLAKRDRDTGLPAKSTFGPWMLPVLRTLARLKGLRGTAFDPFGYASERRQERALADTYRNGLLRILERLTPETLPLAVDYARIAGTIRGYGHVKAANIAAAEKRFAAIEAQIEALSRQS
jgi:indolepyruvate ferredoxin oxidoreductase